MERDFAGVRVSAEAHKELASACLPDGRFPSAYADWLKLVEQGTRQAIQEGRRFDEVVLNAQEFISWCRGINVHASFDALRAYLILRRGGAAVLPGQRAKPANTQSNSAPPSQTPPSTSKRSSARRPPWPAPWPSFPAPALNG